MFSFKRKETDFNYIRSWNGLIKAIYTKNKALIHLISPTGRCLTRFGGIYYYNNYETVLTKNTYNRFRTTKKRTQR